MDMTHLAESAGATPAEEPRAQDGFPARAVVSVGLVVLVTSVLSGAIRALTALELQCRKAEGLAVLAEHLMHDVPMWLVLLGAWHLTLALFASRRRRVAARVGGCLLWGMCTFLFIYYYLDAKLYEAMWQHLDYRTLRHLEDLGHLLGTVAAKFSFGLREALLGLGIVFAILVLFTGRAADRLAGLLRSRRRPRGSPCPARRGSGLSRVFVALYVVLLAGWLLMVPVHAWLERRVGHRKPFTLGDSFLTIQADAFRAMRDFPEDVEMVRRGFGPADWLDPEYPLYRRPRSRPLPHDGESRGFNVVIIVMESFRAADVGALGGRHGITPNFDRLADRGALFTRYYANGHRTANAILSLECSVPAFYGQKYIRKDTLPEFLSLGKLLTANGYGYGFYTGGKRDFDRLRRFYALQGADELLFFEDMEGDPGLSRFAWGIHDGAMLGVVLDRLARRREPFGATILTISCHQPYVSGVWPTGERGIEASFRAAMHESDTALGEFFAAAEKRPFFKRTLFVITADTGEEFVGGRATALHTSTSEAATRVPLLIFAGNGALPAGRHRTVGSHVDILPTIARLLSIQPPSVPWLGRSLFDEDEARVAYYNTPWGGGSVAVWCGDFKTIYDVANRAYRHYRVSGWTVTPRPGPPAALRFAERRLGAYHGLMQRMLGMQRIMPERDRKQRLQVR